MNLVAFGKRNFYIDVIFFFHFSRRDRHFRTTTPGPRLQDHDSRTMTPGPRLQDHDSRTATSGPRLQNHDSDYSDDQSRLFGKEKGDSA